MFDTLKRPIFKTRPPTRHDTHPTHRAQKRAIGSHVTHFW